VPQALQLATPEPTELRWLSAALPLRRPILVQT
jgi:hypothetical protein